ncbi:uncharacterized protein P174DRAFT_405610 [Aspergillus novofumigatus IBT 16806]|uniref:Uncharacterized protein n=1 Tax=Aspergillus novofumigatus (strain IBT 16806) TaxID=1392255 RepID=A0A2I1C7F7_ASPN1|nr:uncharacterized protein P174DRAFT_405610 [Aspergillus novofumigatus IBT 16806]PKX93569.1 hypothetical protein P174DRAFT_405610 [Aspergillus novofumigatus IBT 16806]
MVFPLLSAVSSSLEAKDVDSVVSLRRTEPDVASRTSQVKVAGDRYAHLPFEIPGAVVLSAPSLFVLRETANDVYRRINSDTSYSNQFIIVSNVSQPLQELLAGDRNPLEVPYRLTLDTQHQQVVIRIMPSKAHERVTGSFSNKLVLKLFEMGIRPDDDYTMNRASRYSGRTCDKEADESLTPSRNPSEDDDWPSLVIETGLSESEAQLRTDAHWWFSNSGYQVNTVILVHIKRSPERRVTLKVYKLRPITPRTTRGLQAEVDSSLLSNRTTPQTDSPTVLQPHLADEEITVTSMSVENAPLVLEFESVMRRPPTPNTMERDITFTAEDLAACCSYALQTA